MSNRAAMIGEFKEIIEDKIERQVARYQRLDRLQESHKILVSQPDLFFASLPPDHIDRYSSIPQSDEHVWAIGPNRRIDAPDRYMGNMAIVVFGDELKLSRGFLAAVAGSKPGPFTIRELNEDEVESTLVWVKSPERNKDIERELSRLSDQERAAIDPQIEATNNEFWVERMEQHQRP